MFPFPIPDNVKIFASAVIYGTLFASILGIALSVGLIESSADDFWKFLAWAGIIIFALLFFVIAASLYAWKKFTEPIFPAERNHKKKERPILNERTSFY